MKFVKYFLDLLLECSLILGKPLHNLILIYYRYFFRLIWRYQNSSVGNPHPGNARKTPRKGNWRDFLEVANDFPREGLLVSKGCQRTREKKKRRQGSKLKRRIRRPLLAANYWRKVGSKKDLLMASDSVTVVRTMKGDRCPLIGSDRCSFLFPLSVLFPPPFSCFMTRWKWVRLFLCVESLSMFLRGLGVNGGTNVGGQ